MPKILTDVVIAVDGIDASGDSNQMQLTFSRADLDATTFGSRGKKHQAGMLDYVADAGGFWTPKTDQVTPVDKPVTKNVVVAIDREPGSPAFIGSTVILAGSWGGPIDTLSQWSAQFASRGVERGEVALYGDFSTSSASPGVELGALSADETITATVHTFDLDATATVELQSSSTNGWTVPDVEDTANLTTTGVTKLTAAGPNVNTWWRVAITAISGPSAFLITLHRS